MTNEEKPKQPAVAFYPRGYKTDSRPQRGWWAPGHYLNKCVKCGDGFIGDKRAGWCADCAYKWEAADDSEKAPDEQGTRSLERVDGRAGAAGHIEAALEEAEELTRVYGLNSSAAMTILKNRLKLALEMVCAGLVHHCIRRQL